MKNIFLFLTFCFMLAYSANATNYTVNSLADSNTGSGTSGTLRYCITQANLTAGPHTINFGVSGTIMVTGSALPTLTKSIMIDGSTAPSYVIGTPSVVVDGTNLTSSSGIYIASAQCKIYGLEVANFKYSGIVVTGDTSDDFEIGMVGKGNIIRNNEYFGISIYEADNGKIVANKIGINALGLAKSNLYDGIFAGNNASNLLISNNSILFNGYYGIRIEESANAIISNNVISKNNYGGVDMEGNLGNHQILNNQIEENKYSGIAFGHQANGPVGTLISNNVVTNNHIKGNLYSGISIEGQSTKNLITKNSISCNLSGAISLAGNGNTLIAPPIITTANATTISGTATANATVEIYKAQNTDPTLCTTTPSNQGVVYITSVTANASGAWSVTGSFSGYITANQTSTANNSSNFSVSVYTGVAGSLTESPSNLTSTVLSSTSIKLDWVDGMTAETGFVVERSLNGSTFTALPTLPANTTTFTDTGLTPNTTYYYKVKGIAGSVSSNYTNTVATTTSGGLELYIDSIAGVKGSTVILPVRVKNFSNIVSAQATLQFDNSVVSYGGTSGYTFPNVSSANFNLVGGNKLTFAFYNSTGVNLADGTVLFNISYTLSGALGAKSYLEWQNSPTPLEVADASFTPVSTTTKRGIVQILNKSIVTGIIETTSNTPQGVSFVVVSTSPASQVVTTNATGMYSLELMGGQPYVIVPNRTDSLATNGVTALDLAITLRHILNVAPFTSAYQMIAANVNQDGVVSSLDLALISNFILGQIPNFNGKLGVFINTNNVPTLANPFVYDTVRVITPTLGTHSNLNFKRVKLGDVNNTFNPTTKDTKIINLEVARAEALPQERVVIPFKVRDFTQVGSMQFTLQWNPQIISFVEVKNKALAPNFALNRTAEGILTLAWFDAEGKYTSLPNGSDAFELVFEAKGDAGTESNIDITSKVTPIFAYDVEDKEMLVQRKAGKVSIVTEKTGELLLYPNPTTGHKLYIDAPHKQAYTLAFTNVLGQNVLKLQGDGSDVLDLKRLTKGVYVVQIETNGKITTQKIVIQ